MPSHSRLGESSVFPQPDVREKLTRQLHQTTQPLSVLQGLLELTLVQARTADDYKHSVERAITELNRVIDGFEQLRTLVATAAAKGSQGKGGADSYGNR